MLPHFGTDSSLYLVFLNNQEHLLGHLTTFLCQQAFHVSNSTNIPGMPRDALKLWVSIAKKQNSEASVIIQIPSSEDEDTTGPSSCDVKFATLEVELDSPTAYGSTKRKLHLKCSSMAFVCLRMVQAHLQNV